MRLASNYPPSRYEPPVISVIRDKRAALSEISLYIGAYLVYLVTNGLVYADSRAVGLVNGGRIVSLENNLGFLWEPGWQSWAVENVKTLVVMMNWVYIITYWTGIILAAAVLFNKRRRDYSF